MPEIKVAELFPAIAKPTVTYVKREDGRYEQLLTTALADAGQLCLITGPSKTGKTTLYNNVLTSLGLEPLVVRSDVSLGPNQLWRKALEQLDFDRLKERQTRREREVGLGGKIAGQLGWKWLAGLSADVSTGLKVQNSEAEIREKILSEPSPTHLVQILKKLGMVLVLEDFHYLSIETKTTVFQQWKTFVDNQISVIVIGTTYHAIDIASANQDLLGRICHIEVGSWSEEDLLKIAQQGFEHLKITLPVAIREIPRESAGLPIITQQALAQVFYNKSITELSVPATPISVSIQSIYKALHDVATLRYGSLESDYDNLRVGPRKLARKYETYECVLTCFSADPITFSLKRHEIEKRIRHLPLPEDRRPPPASINSTLRALEQFQKQRNIHLLEWRPSERTLFVLEPAFLFYLRWRKARTDKPTLSILVEELLEKAATAIFQMKKLPVQVSDQPFAAAEETAWSVDRND
jgi:hypothetical protein